MPPGLRRNSIAAGIRAATIIASCPAPLVMRCTGVRGAATARASVATSAGSIATDGLIERRVSSRHRAVAAPRSGNACASDSVVDRSAPRRVVGVPHVEAGDARGRR